jgi:hypothetical protein
MKDLEKLIMGGMDESNDVDSEQPAQPAMSSKQFMAKLDVIREMMDEMQAAMGGRVKGGLDELMSSMAEVAPAEPVGMPQDYDGPAAPDEGELSASSEDSDEEVVEAPVEASAEMEEKEEVVEAPKKVEDDEDDTFFGKKKDKKKFF